MAWRRIVIRPDSIIRWWTLAQLDCVDGFSKIWDSPHIRQINFNTLLATSDGPEHVRTEEMATLGAGLIQASTEHATLFRDIGRHYERLIGRWLRYSERLNSMTLEDKTNEELARLLERWVDYYKAFSPILFVPFIVERRYADEYPALLDKLAELVLAAARARFGNGHAGLLTRVGALTVAGTANDLRDSIRGVLEHSPRRTVAEKKEEVLLRLAARIEDHPVAGKLFSSPAPPDEAAFASAAPELHQDFGRALDEFRWLAHWGYPPRFKDSTDEDFLADLHARIQRGAISALAEAEMRAGQASADYRALLRMVELTPPELQLIDDINYYNFLRTSRMEAKIRAQYLSIPLFREIERRGSEAGALEEDDVFLMVPPETLAFLRTGEVPTDLLDRRDGWILLTHAARGEWTVFSGAAKREFEDGFYGVIDWRDNARGLNNPTTPFAGGKGAGLFRLIEGGHEVPPFFVVTAEGFRRFIDHNHLSEKLTALVSETATDSDRDADVSASCRDLIVQGSIPKGTVAAIRELTPQLGAERLAVRSSATAEDSDEYSWAGRFESVLHVREPGLDDAIKHVWASLFSERALAYARESGTDLSTIPMAVVIQAMVPAEVAGVMNTVLDGAAPNIVEIEAALGYGSAVVNGEVTPDRYLVDTSTRQIVDRAIATQQRMATVRGWAKVPAGRSHERKLAEETVIELALLGKRLEHDLGGPQDVEFAVAGEKISIVQSRPLTGLGDASEPQVASSKQVPSGARLVATGLKGKRAEVLRGRCQVLTDLSQAKDFVDGNILVLTAATPAWDPVVFRAAALITNDGGATSHAIRVSNERQIPAVVGTTSATESIRDGAELVLDTLSDPFKGRVYALP